jgi:hypothetical protein
VVECVAGDPERGIADELISDQWIDAAFLQRRGKTMPEDLGRRHPRSANSSGDDCGCLDKIFSNLGREEIGALPNVDYMQSWDTT